MYKVTPLTDAERWIVADTVKQRYGQPLDIEEAEVELRLDPHSSELTPCPALYWAHDGVNFIISKVGDRRYRAQFFYRVHRQFGTGIDEFDDLSECAVTLLQVQADHAAQVRAEEEKAAQQAP